MSRFLKSLRDRNISLLAAIYLLIHGIFILVSFYTQGKLLIPQAVIINQAMAKTYVILPYFSLSVGLLLFFSGLYLLLWGKNGRFLAIVALIIALGFHAFQMSLLIELWGASRYALDVWQVVVPAYLDLVLWDSVMSHIDALALLSQSVKAYLVSSIGISIVLLVIIYFVSQHSEQDETATDTRNLDRYLDQFKASGTVSLYTKGEKGISLLAGLLLTGGFLFMILGFMYWLVFPGARAFWIITISLVMMASFFLTAILTYERKRSAITFGVFFLSVIFFYVVVRGRLWPEPYYM
ncbi:MAG: hypothetical protein OEZ36_02270, partial [Spirochaetota bacterium]|nr:hypothetical protein [Spirochaetota bacterium]